MSTLKTTNIAHPSSASNNIVLDSSARVGIGTASPAAPLDLSGDFIARNSTIRIKDLGNTSQYLAIYGDATSSHINSGVNNLILYATGTERARIDSSGRFLVGTSTDPTGGDTNAKIAVISGGPGGIYIGRDDGSTLADRNLGQIVFRNYAGSAWESTASIQCFSDGTSGSGDKPGRLVFSTTADGASSPTERMKINNVGVIETFGATSNLSTKSNAGAGTTNFLIAGSHSCTTISIGGTTSFYVWSNGNVQNTNGSYTTISDAKLKENIVNTSSQWNDLKAIQIRNWNFKAETGYGTHRQIGPIAQELEAICPGLVFETPDRDEDGNETGEVTKGVNQSVLYMKAVKALQEAMERIEQLETSNADLLARVTALETV